jgi:hypothetical protein
MTLLLLLLRVAVKSLNASAMVKSSTRMTVVRQTFAVKSLNAW